MYRRDTNGQIWGYIDIDNLWKLIDKSHNNIDTVVAKPLYARTEDSSIYRYTGAQSLHCTNIARAPGDSAREKVAQNRLD